MAKWDGGCTCCECIETTLGSWSQEPTGDPVENDDAEILILDEFNQILSVRLYSEASSTDRFKGYYVRATFNDLQASHGLTDRNMVSLFLDGGSHEVRIRFEKFNAPHSWSFACQHSVPYTLLVQLWRGEELLNETRVSNLFNTHGIAIDSVFGSLHGDEFCGGVNGVANVKVTTTSTHNGGSCWVEILDKGSKYTLTSPTSEEIAVTSLVLTTCKTSCPTCSICEDDETVIDKTVSVFIPNYSMPLFFGGPISCTGGTFIMEYEGACLWTHSSNSAMIYLNLETVSGITRLRMRVASCLDYTCTGFETPVPSTWLSEPLDIPILCGEFDAVEVKTTVNLVEYTAEISSV